jgi:predicted SprT family Zn-dependent metalloprotease
MSAETVPFFCADCDSELTGEAHRQPDGRYICGECKRKLREKADNPKQARLFKEQKVLFDF